MTHPFWPLFDLEVRTPRLTLRYIDDSLAVELARLAAAGIHEPDTMPFMHPWTDHPSPDLERQAHQFWWRCRAEVTPTHWSINFAVIHEGAVIGSTALGADDFGVLRSFETGSWLGKRFQGQGLGIEMRQAAVQLGFDGLHAEYAITRAFTDNPASLGVTRRLGYRHRGTGRVVRRGQPTDTMDFELTRHDWEPARRTDISILGAEAVREFLAISPSA